MIKHLKFGTLGLFFFFLFVFFYACEQTSKEKHWNEKYNFIYSLQPIVFHYDHGILAGSYPNNQEIVEIQFNDVCKYLGHVCLCGAGGYKISEKVTNILKEPHEILERGDFILISSRDHTVSDVIAFVLGCRRRNDFKNNKYFIDTSMIASKREYHYYIGFIPKEKAVHVIYRKHLLIGNELMDSLWKVELAYEENPASINQSDINLYQKKMFEMVKDVLFDQKKDLIETEIIDYDDFLLILKRLNAK